MKKYAKVFISACVFAVMASFTSIGLAIDLNNPPKIQAPRQIDTTSWYYVDAAGHQEGPVTFTKLRQLYQSRAITDWTYLWNGTTVTQWTPLSELPDVLRQLKSRKKPFRRK